ncbi:MAG: hypothetical protein IIA02_09930 [Proteobacteria bacterium]|uniref:DUF4136 domain-containing protein n=1 Tax=Aquabacterium sp. TaxID=1872578 RepID=UPI0035C689E0|nr:hypothetical protein [Pseudomonadota bacterium]
MRADRPTASPAHALRWLGAAMGGWLALLLLLLSGCAATSISSQVQSFGQWPPGRQPGTFVFDLLPSQQAYPSSQGKLEAAALPSLQALGFRLADAAHADKADTLVQLGLNVSAEPRMRYEPYWPYRPHSGMYGGMYLGPYHGPYLGAGWWGPGWVASMDPPWVTLRVDVIVRDRRSSRVLYETHASHDRLGAVDESVLPYLFEAALKDFPNAPPGPRVITLPLPGAD